MKSLIDKILYKCLLWSCAVFGLLPGWIRYGVFGALVYFILYKAIGYRVEVVRTNLRNSFPEKSDEQRRVIERNFYRHLAEVFIDTISLASMSRRKILSRMQYRNVESHEASLEGRSWFAAMSHFGSWELTINYAMLSDHRLLAVYRPLHNDVMERFYCHIRARFGTKPVAMNDILKEVIKSNARGAQPAAVAMIADQTPPIHEIKHWYRFLEQDTPFFSGMEKMAVKFRMPIYFTYVRQTAPHKYEAEFRLIYDGLESVEEHEITQRYVASLEEMIRETPHLWMWSHKRWKHKPPTVQ